MNKIVPISAFSDNYIWAIHSPQGNEVAVVDPGDALPVLEYLSKNNAHLNAILITHHHWDHTGGLPKLLEKYPDCTVYGPETISGINHPVKEDSKIHLQAQQLGFSIISIPGHTLDHIAYVGKGLLFCGDTLFSAGCGRLFEGSPEQMYNSLQKLLHLPEDTQVYCAHEYTLNNLKFAQSIEPDNTDIQNHIATVQNLVSKQNPSLPSTLKLEKKINPFLRCTEPTLLKGLSAKGQNTNQVVINIFAKIREMKDRF